jgi:sugar transferase (PEP-CTERM/EpsH1 system associated)
MTGELLFLCHRIPFPPDRGDKIRSYHLLQRLAQMAPVHVGCFADDDRDMGFAPDMAQLTASQCVLMRDRSRMVAGLTGLARGQSLLVSLFDHPDLHRWVAQVMAERPIRAVIAYSAQMAHFVPMLPAGVRFLMDFVDFDSAKYAAYGAQGSGPMGWINRREGRVLLDFECKVSARADICSFVSEAEAALFRDACGLGADRIVALENGVALDYFDPAADFPAVEKGAGPLIVFTGQMDYRPNVEAVESFARQTLPAIQAAPLSAATRRSRCRRSPISPASSSPAACPMCAAGWPPPIWWWRRYASRAASRTRCSKRWRWPVRSSPRPRPPKALMRSMAAIS